MGSYFQKMREKMTEIMSLNELITNVYYPAYSKYFTISEIETLTAFYESPIGQKYVSSIPAIMQESMTIINQKYTPQLQKIAFKLVQEEMEKIKPEIEKIRKNK
jgi:hypothetical protein